MKKLILAAALLASTTLPVYAQHTTCGTLQNCVDGELVEQCDVGPFPPPLDHPYVELTDLNAPSITTYPINEYEVRGTGIWYFYSIGGLHQGGRKYQLQFFGDSGALSQQSPVFEVPNHLSAVVTKQCKLYEVQLPFIRGKR